ncbi:MAG: bifunctional metallophosphatase/5'-nucleotidase [Alphaproteobacteria bacterium]|nr:bifunctional metallophosphatase/5'-nucleotidase [Alphaproteobacteria bacterium]
MTLLLALLACRPPAAPVAPSAELVLLHTNDMHCHFQPERADWLEGEPSIGGMALLDAQVRALRASSPASLLLDGGDILTGTPLGGIAARGADGGPMLEFMDAIGYDAWVLGNHEFDRGWDNVAALVEASQIPVLSANLDAPGGGPAFPALQDHVVLETGGLKVGVIGLTTEGMSHLAPLGVMDHLVVQDIVDTAQEQVAALEPQVDLIVVLSHVGVDGDRKVAREVDGIDLIVGGHSHTRLEQPVQEGDTWIVQAGSYTRNLGVARLGVVDGAVDHFSAELVDLLPETSPGPASEAVTALVDTYAAQIDAEFGEVLGTATSTLTRDYNHESPLGRWITDVLREATGADVALYNAGGLRADLVAGPISRRAVYEVFPFGNQAVTLTLSGAEISRILEENVDAARGDHASMQVSGASIRWKGDAVVERTIGGAPIEPERLYTVATNSYVAERPDKYLANAVVKGLTSTGRTTFEIASEAASSSPIADPGDTRCGPVD